MADRKKKLLHIIPNITIGGAEKLVLNTISILPEYEHHVIAFQAEPFFLPAFEEVAKVHIKSTSHIFTLTNLLFLRKMGRQIKPDIIHSHLLKTNWLARFAFKGRKLINSIHSLYSIDAYRFHFYTKLLERYSYKNSKPALVFVSDGVKEDYCKNIDLERAGYVVPNFVPDEFFQIKGLPYQASSELKLVAVGNLKKIKNYHLLIEAFKLLKELPISLHIYGEGSLTSEYENEIKIHGLKVCLKGKVESMATFLPNYHALIFPSLYEGLSISLLEAMSAGMPLLLSRIASFENIVQKHAYYFDPANVEACKEAILLMYKGGFPNEWLKKNKKLALQNYSTAVYKQKLKSVYDSISQ
jgi:glycosyltransferase involved in cell wall biosynthesis